MVDVPLEVKSIELFQYLFCALECSLPHLDLIARAFFEVREPRLPFQFDIIFVDSALVVVCYGLTDLSTGLVDSSVPFLKLNVSLFELTLERLNPSLGRPS